MISFKNFSFKYNNVVDKTLKNIDLTINKGEKVLIVGPSGSGKSTLSHCINGLIPFSYNGEIEGELIIDNIDILFKQLKIIPIDDIVEEEDEYKVYTSIPNLQPVTEGLEAEGFKSTSAEFTRVPQNTIEVSDEKTAISIMRLLGKLEEHDDVQNVYANFDIDDDLMAKIEEQL